MEDEVAVSIQRKAWPFRLAFIATLLFLQSAAGGFALEGTGIPLDAFGNPLCVGRDGHDPAKNSGGSHGTQSGCCGLACGATGGMLGSRSDSITLSLSAAAERVANCFHGRGLAVVADEYDPGSPRAPPASA